MDVILLLGPTGVGKTTRSVRLARSERAPIVVLDRVQCCRDLAIGSARPDPEPGIRRLYLDDRTVAEGILPPAQAADRLERLIKELADTTPTLILEGGSISLLDELLDRPDWIREHTVRVEHLLESHPRRYEQAIADRAAVMLGYGSHHRTILHEIADLWPHQDTREPLKTVTGYDGIIGMCQRHGIDPAALAGPQGRVLRHNFAAPIIQAHLAYATDQRFHTAAALPRLTRAGAHVHLIHS